MRFFLCLCLGLLSVNSLAQRAFPQGCKPLTVQGDVVTLDVKKGNLVFIHSLAKNDLWLTHPEKEPKGASAGWTTRIQADHWSALALDKPSFALACIESKPGHEQEIPCEGMVAVCQWMKVKIADAGTFWANEDQPLAELIAALGARGIHIPEAKNN